MTLAYGRYNAMYLLAMLLGLCWHLTWDVNYSQAQGLSPAAQEIKSQWPRLWVQNQPCTMLRVVDGDTMVVHCGNRKETLRLTGIDTPETKHPFRPVEYYGPEASARAKELLPKGTKVWLAFGSRPTKKGGPRGTYGRLLVYLFMPNKKMFNAQMLEEGYATALQRYPHVYMGRFVALEKEARKARRGMWARPDKVKEMSAEEDRYRQQRRECGIKLGSPRFDWVIGDKSRRIYFTRQHRVYFRTNPVTRVLFCSEEDAKQAGYRSASGSGGGKSNLRTKSKDSDDETDTNPKPRPRYRSNQRSETEQIIIADRNKQTYRIFNPKRYKLYRSSEAAEADGYKHSGKKHSKKGQPRTRDKSHADEDSKAKMPAHTTVPDCGGKKPIIANRRSKLYRTPSLSSYKRQRPGKNTVYFCTEAEAQAAGFKKAKR